MLSIVAYDTRHSHANNNNNSNNKNTFSGNDSTKMRAYINNTKTY